MSCFHLHNYQTDSSCVYSAYCRWWVYHILWISGNTRVVVGDNVGGDGGRLVCGW